MWISGYQFYKSNIKFLSIFKILKKFVQNVRIITFLLNVLMYKSGAPLNIFVLKIQNQGKVNFHILRRGAKFQLPIINWI